MASPLGGSAPIGTTPDTPTYEGIHPTPPTLHPALFEGLKTLVCTVHETCGIFGNSEGTGISIIRVGHFGPQVQFTFGRQRFPLNWICTDRHDA